MVTETHVCMCLGCAPEKFPSGPRQSENHMGVRLGDVPPPWRVLLDGVDVSSLVTEAMAGPDGWVVFFNEHKGAKSLCRTCFKDACAEVRYGSVEATRLI